MEPVAKVFGLVAIVLLLISVISHLRGKRVSVYPLFAAALFVALHSITRDSFLHPWDERYHALVALNAMDDPFHPKMYIEEAVPFGHSEWYNAYTWLHKQPLFTWQMALGMKIFGTSVYAMRVSSLLMFMLFAFAVFRATQIYFPKSAFWVTLMMILHPYLILLLAGIRVTDHNDLAFFAWVAVSFWGFIAWTKTKSWKWALVIGVACGAAMLTKWLAGSFTLFLFGLYLIISRDFKFRNWKMLIGSGLLAMVVFLPWQIYARHAFPELYMKELSYNSLHFFEVVEHHGGPWYYHLKIWQSEMTILLLAVIGALMMSFKMEGVKRKLLLTCFTGFLATLIFYTIASTKMYAFTLFLLPVAAFLLAAVLEEISDTWQLTAYVIITTYAAFNVYFEYVEHEQNYVFNDRQRQLKHFALELRDQLPENAVIFNTPPMAFVEFMYHTHLPSYDFVPHDYHIAALKEKGKVGYVLIHPDTDVDSSKLKEVILIDSPLYK